MSRPLGWLAGILLLTVALYARVSTAPLCSYDDYLEVHRAAFEDSRHPAHVFTTPHFDTFKYRPFNRGLNLLTYRIGGGSAVAFRVRNLLLHLVNVLLVAALATRLLRNDAAGVLAAALFAVHPLVDQSIVGSVMTNTAAHGLLLGGLLCWIRALEEPAAPPGWAWLGIACAGASLLFYDSAITFFPTVVLYAVLARFRRDPVRVPLRLALVFVIGSALVLAMYLGLRARFVPHGFGAAAADRAGFAIMAKDAATYAAALLAPFDPVLANAWFHTPLPSELSTVPGGLPIIAGFGIAALGVAVLLLIGWWPRAGDAPGGSVAWFLVGAILLSLAPVLVLSSHASETYVYLPMAFVAMLAAHALTRLARSHRALAIACAGVVLTLASLATAVRNERVRTSGFTAARLLDALPARLIRGAWQVTVADLPGEPKTVRYGFYGFRGTGTIGAPPHADRALTCALQLHFHNEALRGQVVPATALSVACAANPAPDQVLEWVHADGRLEPCPATEPTHE